jgi:hypothetical protein
MKVGGRLTGSCCIESNLPLVIILAAQRKNLSSTKKNIHAVPLHMAIMLAVNSAADKSSCAFGGVKLLDIISLSRLACVSNDEIWGAKPLARQDKAVRSHAYRTRMSGACFLY